MKIICATLNLKPQKMWLIKYLNQHKQQDSAKKTTMIRHGIIFGVLVFALSFFIATKIVYFEGNGVIAVKGEERDDDSTNQRRLSILGSNFKISNDPKTTNAKGYVCNKGQVEWGERDSILRELPSFLHAYHDRQKIFEDTALIQNSATNLGGNGFFHSFITWAVIRKIRPSVIIESGSGRGYLSWMVARASVEWDPIIVRIDPISIGWDGVKPPSPSGRQVDFRGERFQDIGDIDWDKFYQEHGMTAEDRLNTLILLDDNEDHLKRISALSNLGFQHVILDDNYIPGVGPTFSLKNACDPNGRLRRAFNRSPDPQNPLPPRRCSAFHKDCTNLTQEEMQRITFEFHKLIDTYWEGPPLAPLDRPYLSIQSYVESSVYEGPSEWTLHHSKLVLESAKKPLFANLEAASIATGLSEMFLSYESGRYINMAYVKLTMPAVAAVSSPASAVSSTDNKPAIRSSRRLQAVDEKPNKARILKTVEGNGYVCEKGNTSFINRQELLDELPSFMTAYNERYTFFGNDIVQSGITNIAGLGLYHSFIMWNVLRKLRPSVIVESGCGKGYTSWMIAQATKEWNPLIIRMDPKKEGWDGLVEQLDLRGDLFQDINRINWDKIYESIGLSKSDKANTLFILDDHQDQLDRIKTLSSQGFRHVLVDDNYVPGVGDVFSLKDACDANGHLRRAFNSSPNKRRPIMASRCKHAHRDCEKIDPFQAQLAALEMDTIVQTYWEGPPLAPLLSPYQFLVPFIVDKEKNRYEGPSFWTEEHKNAVVKSSKAPLLFRLESAMEATGLSEVALRAESGRYVNIAYVELY